MLAQYQLARRSFTLSHPDQPVPPDFADLSPGWIADYHELHIENEAAQHEHSSDLLERLSQG